MKKSSFLILFLLFILRGVSTAQNIYESIGKKTEVLTLSNGTYQELVPNDTLVRIGTVLFNTVTNEVVDFISKSDTNSYVEADVASRFLSVDPIAREYPELTPYQFASNTPIESIDLDGLERFSSKFSRISSNTWEWNYEAYENPAADGYRPGVELIYDDRAGSGVYKRTFIEPYIVVAKKDDIVKMSEKTENLASSTGNIGLTLKYGTGYALGLVSEKKWTSFNQVNAGTFQQSAQKIANVELATAKLSVSYGIGIATGGGTSLLGFATSRAGILFNSGFELTYQLATAETKDEAGKSISRWSQVNATNVLSSGIFSHPLTQAIFGEGLKWTYKDGYEGIGGRSIESILSSAASGGMGNALGDKWKVGSAMNAKPVIVSYGLDKYLQTVLGNVVSDATNEVLPPEKK